MLLSDSDFVPDTVKSLTQVLLLRKATAERSCLPYEPSRARYACSYRNWQASSFSVRVWVASQPQGRPRLSGSLGKCSVHCAQSKNVCSLTSLSCPVSRLCILMSRLSSWAIPIPLSCRAAILWALRWCLWCVFNPIDGLCSAVKAYNVLLALGATDKGYHALFQGMPSHRDVARLNDMLRTLTGLITQAAAPAPECKASLAEKKQEVILAASEVFLEMSQQVRESYTHESPCAMHCVPKASL